MDAPKLYTAYKRIAPLSIAVYWGLWILLIVWFADLTDTYPNLDDFLAIFLVVVVIWGPLLVGQLVSRSPRKIAIRANGAVVIEGGAPHPFLREQYLVIMLGEISEMSVRHALLSGNYICLELQYGDSVKLYSKKHMFGQSPEFFDLYVALRNAWKERAAMGRETTTTWQETETHNEAHTMPANVTSRIPAIPATTSTPLPLMKDKVKSAVRNYDDYSWQHEEPAGKSKPGNGILVAAIVFCVFLLVMASTISSFHVPDELVAIREAIYTMLVLIGLVLGGIAVVAVVKSRNGEPQ